MGVVSGERCAVSSEGKRRVGPGVGLAAALVALVAVVVGLAVNLGDRPMSAHEIFAAQTAREMVWSGDWVSPTYNGQSRLKKPPMMYWAQAGASKVVGADPPVPRWVARLPSALAAGALAGMTVLLGARVFGREVGVTAGLMACGTFALAVYGSNARPDMLYGALCALATLGWVSASLRAPGEAGQGRDALVGWIGAGLATLAKGPHLPALLLLGLIVHLLIARRGREIVRVVRPLAGLCVFLLISLPWIVAVLIRHPDAPALWWSELIAGRVDAESTELSAWLDPYYLYAIPGFLLPWSVFLPFGLCAPFVRGRSDLARGRVLFWMGVTVVVVMSLPNHRRDYYMLPIVAPTMAVIAAGASDWLLRVMARRGGLVRWAAALACLASAVTLAWLGLTWEGAARVTALIGVAAVMACGVIAVSTRPGAHGVLRLLGVAAVTVWIAVAPSPLTYDALAERTAEFSRRVRDLVNDDDRLVIFRTSDRSLVYAQVVYTTGRIVPEHDDASVIAGLARHGPVFVVVTEDDLPALRSGVRAEVVLAVPSDDEGDPMRMLVRCEGPG